MVCQGFNPCSGQTRDCTPKVWYVRGSIHAQVKPETTPKVWYVSGSIHAQVKPETVKLVFAASPLYVGLVQSGHHHHLIEI